MQRRLVRGDPHVFARAGGRPWGAACGLQDAFRGTPAEGRSRPAHGRGAARSSTQPTAGAGPGRAVERSHGPATPGVGGLDVAARWPSTTSTWTKPTSITSRCRPRTRSGGRTGTTRRGPGRQTRGRGTERPASPALTGKVKATRCSPPRPPGVRGASGGGCPASRPRTPSRACTFLPGASALPARADRPKTRMREKPIFTFRGHPVAGSAAEGGDRVPQERSGAAGPGLAGPAEEAHQVRGIQQGRQVEDRRPRQRPAET